MHACTSPSVPGLPCRVWWALRVHGHTQAYVLEGGWRAWVAAEGAEELAEPCPLKVLPRSRPLCCYVMHGT